MYQEKHKHIVNCLNIYKQQADIGSKETMFLCCINEINDFMDWIIEDTKDQKIKSTFFQQKYYSIAKLIANSHKHNTLDKRRNENKGKRTNDFIQIYTTNDLNLKYESARGEDLIITKKDKKIKEIKHIQVLADGKYINGYDFLTYCLAEIYNIILNTQIK